MVKGAFWQLKGRLLMQKNECKQVTVKIMSLACCVLHNFCIDMNDTAIPAWDIRYDAKAKRPRPREAQNMLNLTKCRPVADKNKNATKICDCFN